jgi:predicted transcriptional regulator YheO
LSRAGGWQNSDQFEMSFNCHGDNSTEFISFSSMQINKIVVCVNVQEIKGLNFTIREQKNLFLAFFCTNTDTLLLLLLCNVLSIFCSFSRPLGALSNKLSVNTGLK